MSRRLDHTGTGITTEELFGPNKLDIENPNLDPQIRDLLIKSGQRPGSLSRNNNGNDDNDETEKEEKQKQAETRALLDAFDDDDEVLDLGININDIGDVSSTELLHRSREEAARARAHANELYAGVEDRRIEGPNGTTVRLDERGRYRDKNNQVISPERVREANAGNPDFADMEEARQGILQARRAEFILRHRERAVGQEQSQRWIPNPHIQVAPCLARLGETFGDAAHGLKALHTAPAFTADLRQQVAVAPSPSSG